MTTRKWKAGFKEGEAVFLIYREFILTNNTRQRWLTCMEKFATFVRNCQDYSSDGVAKVTTQQSIDSATQEDFNPDVKVALIDDGVDPFHDNLSLTIAIGESWCEQVDSDGLQPSYHQSSNGHGTAMAFLIRRICPWVLLYVAKLDEKQTEQSANSFTAASAVKASAKRSKPSRFNGINL